MRLTESLSHVSERLAHQVVWIDSEEASTGMDDSARLVDGDERVAAAGISGGLIRPWSV
jgi:hypothetical protein